VADYSIVFARSARKDLEDLPRGIQSRVLEKIANLAMLPRPAGAKKLVGTANLWRIRIGDYRVVYEIDDRMRIIDVSIIRHRSQVYKDM